VFLIAEHRVPQAPRVTVVTSRLDIGGTERHLTRVLPALQRRGIDLSLYVMERGGPLEAELSAQGVRVEGPKRARFLHWPRVTLGLTRYLRREQPAIVHFFLPRPYVYGSVAAELAGQRRRIMSRRSLTDYQAGYPLLGVLERLLHRRTAALIGNSAAVVEQLAAETGDRQKLALIHNGIQLAAPIAASERRLLRSALQIPNDALTIAVVANLIAYKGHGDFIAALALIKDSLPAPWRLLAIGRDDGVGADLKRQVESANISDNMMWLGERSDVGALLAASDIFVLPSHQEGFSNALLEAMAASLPAIATAVGGNLDAVTDDETGLLVRPNDPNALAAALIRLAGDPALRRRLGDAARQRVQQRFSLDACVARYEKMYRALAEPMPPPVAEVLAEKSGDYCRDDLEPAIEHAH
jgi:glycosyltransferase involved in cell wall biosynthesis